MSHPEFEVSRANLYINSNNRSRAPYTIQDDGKIKLNLDAMDVEASDSQFLRISLLQFSCANTFDRHISPNTTFHIYVGDQINNTLTTQIIPVTGGNLIQCQLIGARYNSYSDIFLDVVNATLKGLGRVYPTSGHTYSVTRFSGGGPVYAANNGSEITRMGTGADIDFLPIAPETWGDLGSYSQNGSKILTASIKIVRTAGSFPVLFDNAADDTAFGFIFDNKSNGYLQCGAAPTSIADMTSFLTAATEISVGLGVGTDSTSPLALGSFGGMFTYSETNVANDTLTITFTPRAPMQFDPSPLLYLRTTATGKNYATSNFSQGNSAANPSIVQPSDILASIPTQRDTIYYESQSSEPMFHIDVNSRSVNDIQLYLSNEYNQDHWRLNAYNASYFVSNLAFTCLLRIAIVQKAVVPRSEDEISHDQSVPARFVSQPAGAIRNGRNTYFDNVTNRLARRGM